MQKSIHPNTKTITYTCACGDQFKAESVGKSENVSVEICNQCHPYYTGENRFVDTEGRIDVFEKKRKASDKLKTKKIEALKAKIEKKKSNKKNEVNTTSSLKDMLKNLA